MILIILWILVSMWIFFTDIFFRIISNVQILFVILLVVFSVLEYHLRFNLYIGLIVLAGGLLIWRFGILGAGDVKLMSILALIVPVDLMGLFFFVISVIGAVMGVFIYICAKFTKIQKNVPYGVAIMGGFLLVFAPFIISNILGGTK